MKFFGISEKRPYDDYKRLENELVYEQVIKYLKKGKQILVFVHSRMETMNFAKELYRLAQENGEEDYFRYESDETGYIEFKENLQIKNNREYTKVTNKTLQEIIPYGLGFHNAGLLRKDRTIVEKLFKNRTIQRDSIL